MKPWLRRAALWLPPLIGLEAGRAAAGAAWTPLEFGLRLLATLLIPLLAAEVVVPAAHGWLSRRWAMLTAAGVILLAAQGEPPALAWLGVLFLGAALLALEMTYGRGGRGGWLLRLLASGAAGGLIVGAYALQSRFAEEEFFLGLQALIVAVYWLLLPRLTPSGAPPTAAQRAWLRLPGRAAALAAVGLALGGGVVIVRGYQASFFPLSAPGYPGIDRAHPFLCANLPSEDANGPGVSAAAVQARLAAQVAANPAKSTPDLGYLALADPDPTARPAWAAQFRRSLLAEAGRAEFTGPAGSVKYGQYLASLRAYFYPPVAAAFPELFTPAERQTLTAWFAAINRRALTAEWVDGLYGLALAAPPQGPYVNQENGAGLLALLEHQGLAAPELHAQNLAYLQAAPRGWAARFRNTDDAAVYQPEWIENAYYQNLAGEPADPGRRAQSFAWLARLARPSGAPLTTNHLGWASLAGHGILGARLTGDPTLLWLADRALDAFATGTEPLRAVPGSEIPFGLTAAAPTYGSCLLYGDSGTPTALGPLAPDKIVLRSGWQPDALYALLNLRFSGWHRYKASATLSLIDQDGPLLGDVLTGAAPAWLPQGRSQFRDKRIPRENLNGLVIRRGGLGAVLETLTGLGGPWEQDPPAYAQVESVAWGEDGDRVRVRLDDWHGWTHSRTLVRHAAGPLIILDHAQGSSQTAAIVWQTLTEVETPAAQTTLPAATAFRLTLRRGASPAELVLIAPQAGKLFATRRPDGGTSLRFEGQAERLRLASVLLTGPWVDAPLSLEATASGWELRLVGPDGEIRLPLDAEFGVS